MGNGLISPGKAHKPTEMGDSIGFLWEELYPHMLFNKINNSQPLQLMDMRTSTDDFALKRIRDSQHCPTVDIAISKAREILFGAAHEAPKKVKGIRYFTFLFPLGYPDQDKCELLSKFKELIVSNQGSFVQSDICLEFTAPTLLFPSLDTSNEVPPTTTDSATIEPDSVVEGLTAVKSNGSTSTHATTNASAECPESPVIEGNTNEVVASSKEESTFKVRVYILPDIDLFFETYKLCDILFESNDIKRTYCSQYYASEILPNFLYLGDYRNATDEEQLKALQITHIIDVTYERLSEDKAMKLGLKYLPIDIWDSEEVDIKMFFPTTNEFIAQVMAENESQTTAAVSDCTKNRVLVHCRAGWSRSPSIVLAFLMNHWKINLTATTRRVVRERPMVCPNRSFRIQLIQYEKELYDLTLASVPSTAMVDPSSVDKDHVSRLCSDEDSLRLAIGEESCLWVGSVTVETAFDRVPINAFKAKSAMFGNNIAELPPDEVSSAPNKPKKPFLKRGEGKKILPTKPINKLKASSKRYLPMSQDQQVSGDAENSTSTTSAPANQEEDTNSSEVLPTFSEASLESQEVQPALSFPAPIPNGVDENA
jgi:protein-tyrosine phosphatase